MTKMNEMYDIAMKAKADEAEALRKEIFAQTNLIIDENLLPAAKKGFTQCVVAVSRKYADGIIKLLIEEGGYRVLRKGDESILVDWSR